MLAPSISLSFPSERSANGFRVSLPLRQHQPGDANQEDGNVHSKWAPKETFPKGVQVDEIGASTQDNGQDKEAQASTQLHADGLVEKVASRVSTMRHYFLRQVCRTDKIERFFALFFLFSPLFLKIERAEWTSS